MVLHDNGERINLFLGLLKFIIYVQFILSVQR